MKQSMRKTTAFICALALTASLLTFNAYALPSFAEETVTAQTVSASGEVTQEQIEENIIGIWIVSEKDGQPVLTNDKPVLTIVSPTEAYSSVSLVNEGRAPWHSNSQCGIAINGNQLTITAHTENGSKTEHQLTITEISSDKFTANVKSTLPVDSETVVAESAFTFVKADDLSSAVLGTWEGKCTSDGSVFDDGKEHRWEYKADGTYVYYNKEGDEWVADDSEISEYFVAGNLLCTRWTKDGTENREWWEISVKDGKMSWTALRANDDGSTYTAAFEMAQVSESAGKVTQEQLEKNIIGKWILAEKDGQPALTNEKPFLTIASPTEAYSGVSSADERSSVWNSRIKSEINIENNILTITINQENRKTVGLQFTVTDISTDQFTANRITTISSENAETFRTEDVVTFVKADDLSEAVFGTWEGKCTSDGSVFDDGKEHRWEYKADGTYVYY